jgi:hypothetical protein
MDGDIKGLADAWLLRYTVSIDNSEASRSQVEETAMWMHSDARFPTVTGSNLQRQKLTLPQDFQGEHNLVFIAFQQWQQSQVDTWIPFAKQLEESQPEVRYYELPTIQQRNALARTFINEGMRAGIPDRIARERTITLYLDKVAFRQALQLPGEDDIYVLLVDRQGQVLWREEGVFTLEKGESLDAAVKAGEPNEVE